MLMEESRQLPFGLCGDSEKARTENKYSGSYNIR